MIDIANGGAKKTNKSNFWRNRCVNHHYSLICTQGKSEGLGFQLVDREEVVSDELPYATLGHITTGIVCADNQSTALSQSSKEGERCFI